jgi:hypothetical protein
MLRRRMYISHGKIEKHDLKFLEKCEKLATVNDQQQNHEARHDEPNTQQPPNAAIPNWR